MSEDAELEEAANDGTIGDSPERDDRDVVPGVVNHVKPTVGCKDSRRLGPGLRALGPGEVQTAFGQRFEIECVGTAVSPDGGWPKATATYLMTARAT